jgi:hypothetical protein
MSRRPGTIISDTTRAFLSTPAGDWQDVPCHHRYYGASALNGGERIVETRKDPRPRRRWTSFFGF